MKNNENQVKNWNKFWNSKPDSDKKISWSKKRILNLLGPSLKKTGFALDAGCGSGFFSHKFSEFGMHVVALDNSEQALEACKKLCKNRIECVNRDLLNPDLGNEFKNKFDLIFSDGLLEHFTFSNQKVILRNFAQMLRPEGRIITLVPNKFSPWQLIRPFMMPGIIEYPMILKRLLKLNRHCGLEVLSAGGLNVLPIGFSPENLFGSTLGMLLYTISTQEVSKC